MYAYALKLKKTLPPPLYYGLRDVYYRMQVLTKLAGCFPRECPICGYRGRFQAVGHPPRYDAECPRCRSVERHRLEFLALEGRVGPGKTIYHFAPEAVVESFLRKSGAQVYTADLRPGRADVVLNLESLDLEDQVADMVVANHVLEHVDDSRALRELFRVLKSGGVLVATVPLVEGWDTTYENAAVTTAKDRDLHFGQWDHVRYYGRDFRERLKAVGFTVTEYVGDAAQVLQYGLLRGERVFLAERP